MIDFGFEIDDPRYLDRFLKGFENSQFDAQFIEVALVNDCHDNPEHAPSLLKSLDSCSNQVFRGMAKEIRRLMPDLKNAAVPTSLVRLSDGMIVKQFASS